MTNWFRNLRQTARKKAMKTHEEGDDESLVDYDSASGPVSRASTPPLSRFSSSHSYQPYAETVSYSHSSSSASVDDESERMDVDRYPSSSRHPRQHQHLESVSHHGLRERPLSGLHRLHHHSDGGSEDDYEEAVTPPPAPAPMPRPSVDVAPVPRVVTSGRNRMDVGFLTGSSEYVASEDMRSAPPAMVKHEDMHVDVARPKIEDALLLLDFSSSRRVQ